MSLTLDPNDVYRDFVTYGVPTSGKWKPRKAEIRRLLSEMQQVVIALAADAGDIALPNLLIRYTITGGDENDIEASPNLTPPAGAGLALFSIAIEVENTGAMTINGKPLKLRSGDDVPAGYITPGLLLFMDTGSAFTLLSYGDPESYEAAVQALVTDFLDHYLGAHADDAAATAAAGTPIDGQLYWDTTLSAMKVWDSGAWVSFAGGVLDGSITTSKLAADATTMPKLATDVRAAMLVNALRAAEAAGPGVSANGKVFTDLLCSTTTLNVGDSSSFRFRRGGIEPSSAPGTYADAAYAATSGSNTGWDTKTIVIDLTEAAIDDAANGCDFLRFTWRAGSGGALTIGAAFVGVAHASAPDFDPAYPIVPILFSGVASSGSIGAGATKTSDAVAFSVPAGKGLRVSFYVSAGGYVGTKTQSGWNTYYKTANEPAKIDKSSYTSTTTILGLERIEYAGRAYANMTVVSGQLPLSASPAEVDVAVFLGCEAGDVGSFALSLSRDGSTWKSATLGALHTLNGRIGRVAFGVDLSSGAGTGSALYWKAVTSGNKAIRLNAIALMQPAGIFTDVPSVDMRESASQVTCHMAATGLGTKPGADVVYGRLWGFTQDWDVSGPTRFKIKFHAQMIHLGQSFDSDPASNAIPVAWTLALTRRYAVDAAAMGAKNYSVTDTTPATGNDNANWIDYSSGNIANTDEHYKEGTINVDFDAEDPGVYRFEVWGWSATTADSPLLPGRIALNWEEASGASVRDFRYNRLQITATPLR